MSRENVELVLRAVEAQGSDYLSDRSEEERAALRSALWDPDCEYTSVIDTVDSATYRGHDGIRRYMGDLADRWSEWRIEPEEVRAIGSDTVLASLRFHAVGRGSGAPIEARLASVFVVSNGTLLRGRTYASREEALEAVGLRE